VIRGLPAHARGAALIVLLALIGLVVTAILISALAGGATTDPDRQTERALAIAHQALIAYAVSVQPDTSAKRPGDLPCPDLDNDGDAETTCSAPNQRIGRLPVETLEIEDLVDGYGERLWYALSGSFDRSTVNQCPQAGDPGCLNSETRGTITVRSPYGAILHDGTNLPSGAIAVIFSPGPPLARFGSSTPQDRSCAGDSNIPACLLHRRCSTLSGTTALCNPLNFLDLAATPAEDNADFADSSTANGFIQGPIFDAAGNAIVNDRLMVLRYADLMPRLEQRVAREALRCLQNYAAASGGRYPWASPMTSDYTTPLADQAGIRFGRLPNQLTAGNYTPYAMSTDWVPPCPAPMVANADKWWANWQNLLFFAVAPGYAPDASPIGCGTGCLTVNAPSVADKRVVVLVAGLPLAGQARGVGTAAGNYLEDENADGSTPFRKAPASGTFDDQLIFQ